MNLSTHHIDLESVLSISGLLVRSLIDSYTSSFEWPMLDTIAQYSTPTAAQGVRSRILYLRFASFEPQQCTPYTGKPRSLWSRLGLNPICILQGFARSAAGSLGPSAGSNRIHPWGRRSRLRTRRCAPFQILQMVSTCHVGEWVGGCKY